MNPFTMTMIAAQDLYEALESLVDAVPPQNNDQDWWPDALTVAMKKAGRLLEEYGE